MSDEPLAILSDVVTDAHTRIQQAFKAINPVVGVNRQMRTQGMPVDLMTIDCLKSGKRIILVLHDEQPEIVRYQFSFKDQDPADQFEILPISELTSDTLYEWIKTYFSAAQA